MSWCEKQERSSGGQLVALTPFVSQETLAALLLGDDGALTAAFLTAPAPSWIPAAAGALANKMPGRINGGIFQVLLQPKSTWKC
jgi:hypothetical protein